MHRPYFSICIPAYNRVSSIKRLLESINTQTYKNYEVIITDDSDGNAISQLLKEVNFKIPIIYKKNPSPLGSPSNWNKAISLSSGEWIKIMHDDDYFSDSNCLEIFHRISKNCKSDFIFSGYNEIDDLKGEYNSFIISTLEENLLRFSPLCLFKRNFIGHPSTTLIRNNKTEWFDPTIKWVVDIEFYVRTLKNKSNFTSIKKPLINIGIGATQITKQVFRKSEIEIPENIYLIKKIGVKSLKNIFVCDYYWRLFRNLKIVSTDHLDLYYPSSKTPNKLKLIILLQNKIGIEKIIKNRHLSKIMMSYFYIRHILFAKIKE